MAKAKRALERRQRSLTDLPEEILSLILLLLPPKSILRCRAVCKALRCLASDRAFLLAHHRRQPPLRLYSFIRDVGNYSTDLGIFDYCLEALDLLTHEFRSVTRFTADDYDCAIGDNPFAALASCDGLLVMSWRKLFYLCNPTTRQWISISPLRFRHDTVMGLYCHGPSSEYRVLYCRRSHREPLFFTCTVGSEKESLIQHRLSSVIRSWSEKRYHLSEPFLFNGNLYWMPSLGPHNMILVFNTVGEVFQWLHVSFQIQLVASLLEVEGCLAMSNSHFESSEVDLWLLDCQSSVWIHKYCIQLPVIDIRRFEKDGDWCSHALSQERDVLVDGFDWQLHYDRNGNLLKKFKCDGRMLIFCTHILRESLVPHAFFQVQGNGVKHEPPFFWGL